MAYDEAGPIIGWSLSHGLRRRPIHDLVDFPSVYSFKAVGVAEDDFVSSLLERVGRVLGREVEDEEHRVRESEHGRYQSVTIDVVVTSGDQVYSVYEAMHEDERVRYML